MTMGTMRLISRPRVTKYLTHNDRDRDKGKENEGVRFQHCHEKQGARLKHELDDRHDAADLQAEGDKVPDSQRARQGQGEGGMTESNGILPMRDRYASRR